MELGELYAATPSTNQRRESSATCWDTGTYSNTIRYDTIAEFNVDSKVDYTA